MNFLQKIKKCKLASHFVGILPKLIIVGRHGVIDGLITWINRHR
jgi:hypothetical protein